MRIHLNGVIIIWDWLWAESNESDISSSVGHAAVDADETQRNDYLVSVR